MKKVYIYLAQRNKKGIKLLCVILTKNEYAPMKISNVSQLGLNLELQEKLEKVLYENRMLWDLWIETSENYNSLKKSLKKRGYYEIPMFSSPLFQMEHLVLKNSEVQNKTTDLTIKPVVPNIKTMIRRMKE